MKKLFIVPLIVGLLAFANLLGPNVVPTRASTNYYIDSVNGDNGNNGESPATAWETLAKVNEKTGASCSSNCAQAGDTFSLVSGSFFDGMTLELAKNGTAGSHITINKYGAGVDPIIANVDPCVKISGNYNKLVDVMVNSCHAAGIWTEYSYSVFCQDNADNDGDGRMNDGCPSVGGAAETEPNDCTDTVDDDSDGYINDGCKAAGPQPTGVRIEGDNNILDSGSTQNNMMGVKLLADADSNRVTNYLFHNNNKADGTGSSSLGVLILSSNNELDHSTVRNSWWTDPYSPNGREAPTQCSNTSDDDADTLINDGCPQVGSTAETACSGSANDDAGDDSVVNDGCAVSGGGTCRRGDAVEIFGAANKAADNNDIHHNLVVDSKTFSELGIETSGSPNYTPLGSADDNEYTFNVIRGSLGSTLCTAGGTDCGSNLNGQVGLVTRGGGENPNPTRYGPVYGTVFNNNTIYFTGACSQGITCAGNCGSDIVTVKNAISVAVWKGMFLGNVSGTTTFPASTVDYSIFRRTGTASNPEHCQFGGSDCPDLTIGLEYGIDPKFSNPGSWNLDLQCHSNPPGTLDGSPALEVGASLGYSEDHAGRPVPADADEDMVDEPDMGAHENCEA